MSFLANVCTESFDIADYIVREGACAASQVESGANSVELSVFFVFVLDVVFVDLRYPYEFCLCCQPGERVLSQGALKL